MNYWKGETYHILHAMKATGNRPGVIAQWKEEVAAWAQMNRTLPDAAAVNAWLPLWEPRPFYTVEELAPMWPALSIVTGFTDKWTQVPKSPARLNFELDFHGAPRLPMHREFIIVERIHHWLRASEDQLKEVGHVFSR